jgi:SAM-dependent methyltransferase
VSPVPNIFGDAAGYDRFMGRWSRLAAPLFSEFAGLPDHGSILDLGCGTGSLSFVMAAVRPNCRIVGIDRSADYVSFARNRVPRSSVQFQTADAQSLPFSSGAFDSVVSLLVFNFIPDPTKALAEAHRVTRRGGSISAAVWDYSVGMRMLRAFWDSAVKLDPSADHLHEKHMPLCRAGQLAELWRSGGLREVEESSLEFGMRFENYDDFWTPFLFGQGPAGAYLKRLSADRIEALRDLLMCELGNPTDQFVLPARLLAVRGSVPLG